MKISKFSIKIFWAILAILVGVLLLVRGEFLGSQLKDIQNKAEEFIAQDIKREVLTPEPLRGPLEERESKLTRKGIIEWTNIHRREAGVPPLSEDVKLNESATRKARDMLEKQYFAHNSPTGNNVSYFANEADYNFILIGENLALGNFKNDEALLQAWMDSAGHRENILHEGYTEIGVGLVRGDFQGTEVWFAVQHFGKPESACPQPDTSLKTQLEQNKEQLSAWEEELKERKEEIDNTSKDDPSYNSKVEEYNALADKYNSLSQETKSIMREYNNQVQIYNECARS